MLIKAIVLVFYSGDGRQGLARSALTRQYFEPIGVNPLLIVATMICHSLNEFETGSKTTLKFDGRRMSGMLSHIHEVLGCR